MISFRLKISEEREKMWIEELFSNEVPFSAWSSNGCHSFLRRNDGRIKER